MSRSTVRNGVAAYFGGTAVPGGLEPGVYTGSVVTGLATTRTSMPREIPDSDFGRGLTPPFYSSATLIVQIGREVEQRISYGGTAPNRGQRRIDYTIDLVVVHRSLRPDAETAQADFDATVDSLAARLRADPTLGGTVWQAGENTGSTGGASITTDFGEYAVDKGGALTCTAVVRFTATEWIQG